MPFVSIFYLLDVICPYFLSFKCHLSLSFPSVTELVIFFVPTFFLSFSGSLTESAHHFNCSYRCVLSCCVLFNLAFVCVCFFQKAVEEEESQVRKSVADLCPPGSKLADADPARKVSRCFTPVPIHPSTHHISPSPPTLPTSSSLPPPLLYTQVSSQGHHPHPD